MINNFVSETKQDIKDQTSKYLLAAFGFVVGLAWNDAVKSLIESIFPVETSGVWVKFLYAIIVTIAIVLVGKYVFKSSDAK